MKELKEKIWPMTPNQSFFAAAVLIFLLFFIFLFTAIGEQIFCWIDRNSGLAAWVQAVGSVVAIFIAIWVSTSQIRHDKKSMVSSLRILYLVVLEGLIDIKVGIMKNKIPMMLLANVCIEEQLIASRAQRPEILPVKAMKAFKLIQLFSAQINYIIKDGEIKKNQFENKDLLILIDVLLDRMKSLSGIVFDGYNGVAAEVFYFDDFYKKYVEQCYKSIDKGDELRSS